MTEQNQHSNPDAEIVLAWITSGYHKEGHHPNCSTRTDKGCDCYARASAPARAAVGRLEEQLSSARATLLNIASADWDEDNASEVLDELQILAAQAVEGPNPASEPKEGA